MTRYTSSLTYTHQQTHPCKMLRSMTLYASSLTYTHQQTHLCTHNERCLFLWHDTPHRSHTHISRLTHAICLDQWQDTPHCSHTHISKLTDDCTCTGANTQSTFWDYQDAQFRDDMDYEDLSMQAAIEESLKVSLCVCFGVLNVMLMLCDSKYWWESAASDESLKVSLCVCFGVLNVMLVLWDWKSAASDGCLKVSLCVCFGVLAYS